MTWTKDKCCTWKLAGLQYDKVHSGDTETPTVHSVWDGKKYAARFMPPPPPLPADAACNFSLCGHPNNFLNAIMPALVLGGAAASFAAPLLSGAGGTAGSALDSVKAVLAETKGALGVAESIGGIAETGAALVGALSPPAAAIAASSRTTASSIPAAAPSIATTLIVALLLYALTRR